MTQRAKASPRRARNLPKAKRPRRTGNKRAANRRPDATSQCARDYLKALSNPFDAPPVCVPWLPALTSQKMKSWTRGVLATQVGGANAGIGYILVAPFLGNDSNWLSHTNFNSTNGVVSSIGTNITRANHNGPYTDAQYTSNTVMGRIVSIGARIRYIGKEIDRNGYIISLEHPNHQTLETYSPAQIRGFRESHTSPVTRGWHTVTWQPVVPIEFSYTDGDDAPSLVAHYNLLLMVLADVGTSISFEYEAVVNYELIGTVITNGTPSHADILGTSKAIEYVSHQSPGYFDEVANYATTGSMLLGSALGGLGVAAYGAERTMRSLGSAMNLPR